MKKKKTSRRAASARFVELEAAIGTLHLEAEPGELARQVVEAVAAHDRLDGARLWRVSGDAPVLWHSSGSLPAGDPERIGRALAGEAAKGKSSRNGRSIALALSSSAGEFAVLEAHAKRPLDAPTQRWLELFGQFAGLALESSEHRHAVAELSAIVEATKRLNSTLDLGELINIILQIATRQTDADRGTVFLVDRDRDEIWSLVGLGLEQHEIRLPATRGVAGWVVRHGETVNLTDAYNDPRFEKDVDRRLGYRTRSLLCLPIRNKDEEVVGVLQLLNKRGGMFTAGDESFLRALSDHVALALENAQLHRERLAKQKMERDLALARSIQVGLLPEGPPRLDGFDIAVSHRPSLTVGGDYYDFIPVGPETMLTVVADVEGKGVSSAMVMANLQATLHALMEHLHSLERLVASLNDTMLSDTRGQKYMTMFLSLLDQRHRVLHYVNAGHVPQAVIRADGSAEMLEQGGTVVGLFPKQVYERGQVKLAPGDVVVGCTDGITEAMDTESNEFGLTGLIEHVRRVREAPAAEIVRSVLEEVDRFSLGGPHEDDRVILICKVF